MAHAQATVPARPRPRWQVPLLAGVCFGLGYGTTHRLLSLQWPSLVRLGQGFEVRPFPGTSLESLRLRFGADTQEIRGDLDLLQLENKPDADPTAAKPEAQPAPEPEAGLRGVEQDPGPLPEPRLPAPRLDAPAPPQLPSADPSQATPEAGPQ